MSRIRTRQIASLLIGLTLLAGCSSTYYSAWQKLGYEKRDILSSRVKKARDDQDAAKTQFQTTLQRFYAISQTNGGDLQSRYDELSADYDRCKSRADAVTSRVKSVDTVAHDLFAEWESELSQYKSDDLRRQSQEELSATKDRYAQLYDAMTRVESRMHPVLDAFHDQVLFLKHNLNARAIASLDTTTKNLDQDVTKLIADMNTSIAEANRFIDDMKKNP